MVRFSAPPGPLLWIDTSEELEQKKEGDILFLKSTKKSIPFFLVGFCIIIAALLFGAVQTYSLFTNDSACDPRYEDQVELGSGEIYCEESYISQPKSSLTSVEVADQHFKYIVSWDGDSTELQEFRWSEESELLTVGQIFPGGQNGMEYYECVLYKRNSSLSPNWSSQEFNLPGDYWSSMPNWCWEEPTSTDNLTYSPADGPLFEGESLYIVFDGNYGWIEIGTYTEDSIEYRTMSEADSNLEKAFEIFVMVTLILIVGTILMIVGDNRKMNILLNTSTRTISIRKIWGGTRLSGWTWKDIDFSTLALKQFKKSVQHSSGGGDDGSPIEYWTTHHKGIEVSFMVPKGGNRKKIKYKPGQGTWFGLVILWVITFIWCAVSFGFSVLILEFCGILLLMFCLKATYSSIKNPEKYIIGNFTPGDNSKSPSKLEVLFLEHGEHLTKYDSTLQLICDSLSLDMPEMKRDLKSTNLSKKSALEMQLKDFSVSEWDSNNDAKELVQWYNEFSSKANNLSLRQALKGIGIRRLRSEQDAQKLLDYLAKLLAEEAGENVTEVTAKGRQDDSTETMTEEDDGKQSGTTNGFWDDV